MRASVRSAVALLLLTVTTTFSGCGERARSGVLGVAPATVPVHLTDLPGVVSFEDAAPASPADAPLLRLERAALDGWRRSARDGGVRFESPTLGNAKLGDAGLAEIGSLHVRLSPGGAHHVAVVPYAAGEQLTREQRALRRLEISLERDADPDAPVELAVDLYEALHGNFGDAARGGRLEKLEIVLPGADPDKAVLHSLVVLRRDALPPGEHAVSRIADHRGVLRPSWIVRGGAAVEIELSLPDDAPELRWVGAAVRGTGRRIVELAHTGGVTLLADDAPTHDDRGAAWKPRTASLASWAGQRVRIRFRAEDSGVAFFGDPTIVRSAAPREAPDVLVYLIDTLRADHLGAASGDRPDVSPTLDRLAREGVWFRQAQSSSPWTKPAIATLMSGVLPTTHRVGATSYTDRMPTSVPLFQQTFRHAGWRAGSFSASPLGSTLSALERGFDAAYPPRFWRSHTRLATNPAARQLHDALLDWIDEQPDRPFLAYVHTLEVHEWKLPRYQSEHPAGFSAYDAAIFDADCQLGELLAALDARRPGRELVVVVVSDHGESWGDHGMPSHGFGLYQSQIHVPLLFWKSGGGLRPRTIDAPVSLADVGPTLLDGFGLPALEEEVDGHSLAAALAGGEIRRGPVLSALLRFVWAPRAPRQYAVTSPERIVRIRSEDGPERSYDLVLDPRETQPLTDPEPALGETLDALLAQQAERAAAFESRHGPVVPGPVTHADTARLRALGYLESSPADENEKPH